MSCVQCPLPELWHTHKEGQGWLAQLLLSIIQSKTAISLKQHWWQREIRSPSFRLHTQIYCSQAHIVIGAITKIQSIRNNWASCFLTVQSPCRLESVLTHWRHFWSALADLLSSSYSSYSSTNFFWQLQRWCLRCFKGSCQALQWSCTKKAKTNYLGGACVIGGGPFCMPPWLWLYWLYCWGAETGGGPEVGGPLAGPEMQETSNYYIYTPAKRNICTK